MFARVKKTLLTKGWRQSMPNESWYRRINSWLAIVTCDAGGFRITLRRTERTLEDAFAVSNEVLTGSMDEET